MRLDTEVRAACLATLKAEARTDYLTNLLLPEPLRDPHLALRAFHAELVSVPFKVREAMAGQIRLQWWRDVVERKRDVEARSNPAAAALLAFLDHLPEGAAALASKVDAHEADLYGDAPTDLNALEGYAGETRSVLYQLVIRAADAGEANRTSDASGHAGVAEYMAETLVNWPAFRPQGRAVVPDALLRDAGADREAWLGPVDPATEAAIVGRWAEIGASHADAARAAVPVGTAKSVFRPLRYFGLVTDLARARPAAVREYGVRIGALRQQWLLLRGP